jgi:hypothetical protein
MGGFLAHRSPQGSEDETEIPLQRPVVGRDRQRHPQGDAQAQGYGDDLRTHLPAKPIDVLMIGGRRAIAANPQSDPPNLRVLLMPTSSATLGTSSSGCSNPLIRSADVAGLTLQRP